MTVRTLFFAHFQDLVGSREVAIVLPRDASVEDCAAELCRLTPALGNLMEYARVSVNAEFADAKTVLAEGDEIAFLPPMSGG